MDMGEELSFTIDEIEENVMFLPFDPTKIIGLYKNSFSIK